MIETRTAQQMVTEFHEAFGVAMAQPPTPELCTLRIRLVTEECREFVQALQRMDLAQIAQEAADLVYVVYGAAVSLGIDLDAAIAEVHRANMRKLGPDGAPILRRDGKVMKPAGWEGPDMTPALPVRRDDTAGALR